MTSYVILDDVGQAKARRNSERLVEQLVTNGALSSPEWRKVFPRVPRHVFAPQFRLPENYGGLTLNGRNEQQQDGWLRSVYANEPLLTAFGDDGALLSTCSSPTVVARMVEALDVATGHSVLEIGTGTGWNAGLLAERLGSDAVTSIDVDPAYIEAARERLAFLGLHPTLALADGYAGYPERGPYDRIIATCAVRQIPPAWLQQVRTGGVILADIRGSFAGGVARITRTADGGAIGSFLRTGGAFMPLRSPESHAPDDTQVSALIPRMSDANGEKRSTDFDLNLLNESNSFGFFAQLALPGSVTTTVEAESLGTFFCLLHPESGAWARVELGDDDTNRPVVQGGGRHLWDELEASYELWGSLDRPARDHFSMTITRDGEQFVYLNGTPYKWRLPL
jgi:protein-L-isoaspartate(D-aspartate) O-methyltransferase